PVPAMHKHDGALDRALGGAKNVGHRKGVGGVGHRGLPNAWTRAGLVAAPLKGGQETARIGRARIDVVIVEAVFEAGRIQPGPLWRRRVGCKTHCTVPTLGIVSNSTLASRPSTFSTRRI